MAHLFLAAVEEIVAVIAECLVPNILNRNAEAFNGAIAAAQLAPVSGLGRLVITNAQEHLLGLVEEQEAVLAGGPAAAAA